MPCPGLGGGICSGLAHQEERIFILDHPDVYGLHVQDLLNLGGDDREERIEFEGGVENLLQIVHLREASNGAQVLIALALVSEPGGHTDRHHIEYFAQGLKHGFSQRLIVADDLKGADQEFFHGNGDVGERSQGASHVEVGVILAQQAGGVKDERRLLFGEGAESARTNINETSVKFNVAVGGLGQPCG